MPSLIFTIGPLAGRRLDVADELVLGRDEAADVVVNDSEISRRHAALRPAGDTVEVEDLDSLNGTWVNGERIGDPRRLVSGDVVRFGGSQLELASAPASATPTVASREPRPQEQVAPQRQEAPRGQAMPVFAPPPAPARRSIATRRLTPTVLSFAVVIATALALLAYFAAR
jgi:pSer/pThr/pTyr-binding forkhead associated (FHA) protein